MNNKVIFEKIIQASEDTQIFVENEEFFCLFDFEQIFVKSVYYIQDNKKRLLFKLILNAENKILHYYDFVCKEIESYDTYLLLSEININVYRYLKKST